MQQQRHVKPNGTKLDRRGFIRKAGVTSLGFAGVLGSAPTTVNASGDPNQETQPLDDIPLDLLLHYSVVGQGDEKSEAPNKARHYGYPSTPAGESPTGGMYFAHHDPPGNGGGSFFNTSDIELTAGGGTLHHTLRFFAGFLITEGSKPKPYNLTHKGDGLYASNGQVMNFETKQSGEIDFPSLPPFEILTDPDENLRWRAAGTDRIKLETTDGVPTTVPEWGLTRVDFYSLADGKPTFMISLLYVIWNPEASDQNPPFAPLTTGIPSDADTDTRDELIDPGRLNIGGRST